jgi:hypothetical protein
MTANIDRSSPTRVDRISVWQGCFLESEPARLQWSRIVSRFPLSSSEHFPTIVSIPAGLPPDDVRSV